MTGFRSLGVSALVLAAAACGIPKEKYEAAVAEQQRAIKGAEASDARAADLARQGDELRAKLAELEQAREAALADAARQRSQAGELASAKARLEAEMAAATTEAERQRLLAAQLEAEKKTLEQKSSDYQSLASSLDQEIKAGRVQLTELQGKLTVRMAEKVLFPSGSATVSKEGQATLRAVAAGLKEVQGRIIRVEGHTDNVPIHSARFPSNWELSSARAIAVVRVMQAEGVDPALLGAAGYAEYQPIAANDSAEGRAQNRRIEISLALPPSAIPQAE
jgi:chemotaxis protein MotB